MGKTLADLFDTFQYTAFRLEGLPIYNVPEEIDTFVAFKSESIPSPQDTEWSRLVASSTKAGKKIQRLRLISDELTEYEVFEIAAYSGLSAGEEIRLTRRNDHPYEYDFWLFDNRWISKMNYTEDGSFIGSEIREISDNVKQRIDYWLSIFNDAIPLE